MFTFLLFLLWLATAGLLFLAVMNRSVYEWLVQLLSKAMR